MIRAFDDPNVVHVDGKIDPAADIETINTELILADLQTLENALPRLQKEARLHKDKQAMLDRRRERRRGPRRRARRSTRPGVDPEPLRELTLMTTKPFLYVFNVDPDELGEQGVHRPAARRSWPRPRRSSSTPRPRPS